MDQKTFCFGVDDTVSDAVRIEAKMAMKFFVKRVFTIFASNASFLRLMANLQN